MLVDSGRNVGEMIVGLRRLGYVRESSWQVITVGPLGLCDSLICLCVRGDRLP